MKENDVVQIRERGKERERERERERETDQYVKKGLPRYLPRGSVAMDLFATDAADEQCWQTRNHFASLFRLTIPFEAKAEFQRLPPASA
jgi:hypothetical protein